MKVNTPRSNRTQPQPTQPAHAGGFTDDLPDPLQVVEHLSVAGFIRRCPHRFHIDEILRFGDKAGRVAEALQVSFLTTIDRQLGQVRIFPVPMLQRVYEVMAAQFGWEVTDPNVIEDKKARVNERTRRALTEAVAQTEDPTVHAALETVMRWIDGESVRLETAPQTAAPGTPPHVVK